MIPAAQLPGAAAAAEPHQYFLNYIRIFGALRKLMVDPGYIGSGGKKGQKGAVHDREERSFGENPREIGDSPEVCRAGSAKACDPKSVLA